MRISAWSSAVCPSALQEAFGARALHRQFSHDLRPAVTLRSQQRVGREFDTVEDHLVEMDLSSDVANAGNVDAGQRKIDQELRQANVAILASGGRSPRQNDHVAGDMRPGRPDFPPLEQPSGRRARRLRLNCSEIRSRLRLAHPRSEEHTSELQSLMRSSYADFCLQTKY